MTSINTNAAVTEEKEQVFEKTSFAQYGDILLSGCHSTTSNGLKTGHQSKFLVDLKSIFCMDTCSFDGKSSVLFSLIDYYSR